jgi:zinc/manganese transport system permease protein
MNLDALDLSIIGPAFLAGLLVLATHVPLGREVLNRGIIFIDLAVAQIAALGVIAASALGWQAGIAVQAAAVGAAVIGAMFLHWTENRFGRHQEAVIGVVFVLAATGGILLLSKDPHGGDAVRDLLVGQILWVELAGLLPMALLYGVLLAIWFGLRERMGSIGFYLVFAVAVTASVQLVGVYLVFASLIIPALATQAMDERRGLIWAWGLGAVGYLLGLAASAVLDLPSGAVIVWSLALVAVIIASIQSHRDPEA